VVLRPTLQSGEAPPDPDRDPGPGAGPKLGGQR
jgi:hypothetical protein